MNESLQGPTSPNFLKSAINMPIGDFRFQIDRSCNQSRQAQRATQKISQSAIYSLKCPLLQEMTVVYLLDMSNKVWFKSHQVVLDIGG